MVVSVNTAGAAAFRIAAQAERLRRSSLGTPGNFLPKPMFGSVVLALFERLLMRIAYLLAVFSLVLVGCQREERELRLDPPVAAALDHIALMQNGIGGAPPEAYFALDSAYESNAYNLSQGKRLYSWFGCKSCHGDGRGGIGPSFLDGWWLYGPEAVSIFASIRDGRPHGMPAFRDRMTTEQIWQLAGYVQTIGAYFPRTGAPGRDDDKQTRPGENRGPASILFDQGPTPLHPDQGPTP